MRNGNKDNEKKYASSAAIPAIWSREKR